MSWSWDWLLAWLSFAGHRSLSFLLCYRAVLFQLNGSGLHGTVHTFEKPWFTTFESALACWVTLLLFALANLAKRCWGKARRRCRAAASSSEANGSAEPLLPCDEEGATEGGGKVPQGRVAAVHVSHCCEWGSPA